VNKNSLFLGKEKMPFRASIGHDGNNESIKSRKEQPLKHGRKQHTITKKRLRLKTVDLIFRYFYFVVVHLFLILSNHDVVVEEGGVLQGEGLHFCSIGLMQQSPLIPPPLLFYVPTVYEMTMESYFRRNCFD
jgi:hypothetical protein